MSKIIRSNDELNALANGKELIVNGDFSNGTAGWTGANATTAAAPTDSTRSILSINIPRVRLNPSRVLIGSPSVFRSVSASNVLSSISRLISFSCSSRRDTNFSLTSPDIRWSIPKPAATVAMCEVAHGFAIDFLQQWGAFNHRFDFSPFGPQGEIIATG